MSWREVRRFQARDAHGTVTIVEWRELIDNSAYGEAPSTIDGKTAFRTFDGKHAQPTNAERTEFKISGAPERIVKIT